MSINKTLNYLLARQGDTALGFGATLTTASSYLNGPGGTAGDGFPMPRAGRVTRLDVWDGAVPLVGTDNVSFIAGDRLSVYATAGAGVFDISLRVNGVDTTLVALGAAMNATLYAVIDVKFE